MAIRPQKTWRMSYWGGSSSGGGSEAMFTLLGDPDEARMHAGPKSFVSVKEDGITLSGGFPSKLNIQGLSSSFLYAGMIQDLPWPLSMIPSTTFTPLPKQMIKPPMLELIPEMKKIANIASSFLGV